MKMPNDDFLEPLRKRPNISPRKDFENSLHEKIFEEVKRRRSMSSWKFRLGMVAVLLILIIINPLELLITNHEIKSNINEELPSSEYGSIYKETEKHEFPKEYPSLKTMHDMLINFGIPEESADIFINYQYGLLNNDLSLIKQFGYFSDSENSETFDQIIHYYKENVNLSTLKITNIERSLGEPDFFITAQYENFTGELLEITYILTNNGQLVFDPVKNFRKYFIQKKIIEINSATIEIPYFQGELRGIGEVNSLDKLNMFIKNKAITSSYDKSLGIHGDVTGKIIYDIDSVVSIEFQIEWSSEEIAHQYTTSNFLTFDLTKGQVMNLLDFVSEEELPQLEERVRQLIKTDKMYRALVEHPNELTIPTDQSFYLSIMDGGIVLYYPRYTLSSMTEVRIHSTLGK